MASNKSLDESKIICAMLSDAQRKHPEVFTLKQLRLTQRKLQKRIADEGLGFLTKTLPSLGKHFDKVLAGQNTFDSVKVSFSSCPNSKLPRFLGELFACVLSNDGHVLSDPSVACIKTIRDILYSFYKYKLPYSDDQEQNVIQQFVKTEEDVKTYDNILSEIAGIVDCNRRGWERVFPYSTREVLRRARCRIHRLLSSFNYQDICPKHGPGAVSTKERLWNKYKWTAIPSRLAEYFPIDTYFYASLGHICDQHRQLSQLSDNETPARVILVPKDSRGPRLISCEPLYLQWIQQGLLRALVGHIERHPLTRDNVHFTDQQPNQFGALLGSRNGAYATLDLKEASDRISCGLVRLLFPEPLLGALMASRSSSTVLPNGEEISLHKFAPMGSAVCFPVLALCIWSILTAAAPDAYTRERVLVYGDDVIVPTAFAECAMNMLESVGLLVNRDKSCTSGLFRESCGCDAYLGHRVTPVRYRTVWSSDPCPDHYCSWIDYSNQLYDKGYFSTYDLIVEELHKMYGAIPACDMHLACPSLREVSESNRPQRVRSNSLLQRREYRVRTVRSITVNREVDGWFMLLRFFSEAGQSPIARRDQPAEASGLSFREPISVRAYTKRKATKFAYVWCAEVHTNGR